QMDHENRSNITSKVYRENTEEDIKLTWQRVNNFNGHPIPFSDIENGFELDTQSTFISLLYLANWDRIKVWQRSFPRGEIMVKNISAGNRELKFGDLDKNLGKAEDGVTLVKRPGEMIVEKKNIPKNWNT
ncbi:MAG: hypothetical protein U9R75_00740, partial [Candidatus Thermoplasmatota archaeon]|nr:hypothetical protein [Candidatus Thermoplasmatota archaeon]